MVPFAERGRERRERGRESARERESERERGRVRERGRERGKERGRGKELQKGTMCTDSLDVLKDPVQVLKVSIVSRGSDDAAVRHLPQSGHTSEASQRAIRT